MIESVNYEGKKQTLKDNSGKSLSKGDLVVCFRGERYVLTGGKAPHKPSSQGKVWVTKLPAPKDAPMTHEFYPAVFDLKWS
jgi:hypothetical protein